MSTTETRWVYGSYFSTSGGKNFVRPYISYNLTYTDTSVIVSYTAGINVKSNYTTNAKFTSTFSATGQTTESKTVNNKGWEGGNHIIFDGRSSNIVYSKSTTVQTKTLKMASKTNVDSSSVSLNISIPSLGLPTISDAIAERVESTPTSVTVSFKASSSNNSAITAKINGEVVTAVNGIYSKTFTNVSSDQHNYTITATDSIGTSTRTLTVPKLAPPQVDVICARNETDATKVIFNITVNSFYKDNISNISIVVGSISATATGGEIDDSNALTVIKELTGLAETSLTATVSVTGYGGTTTLNVTIPSAFKTFDVGGEGKTIAFGMTARDEDVTNGITIPENGLFECGMDADFKGDVLANKIKDYGFATADIVKLINHLGAGYKRHENVNGSEGTTEIVIDSIKVVFGYSTITPSKALTSTYTTVNFGCTFGGNPDVALTLFGSPQIATLNLSVSANTTTNFTAHIYASNTTTRGFKFIAIGKAPADERTKNIT